MQKPEIALFYRNPYSRFSIERVFDTLLPVFKQRYKINKVCVKQFRATPLAMLSNLIYVFRNRGKINHITGDIHYCTLLLPKRRTILTIHDLVGVEKSKGFKRYLLWLFWFYLPVKKSKVVTCISEYTRNELIRSVKCDSSKVRVIHNPISPDYEFVPKAFNDNKPIILHIGTTSNKNLDRIIPALNGINCELRIVGRLNDTQKNLLEIHSISYENLNGLTDSEIVNEYMTCDVVSFPSTYEGFGMPIIEGQATGRIVVTSNIPPMTEIANDSAILVDPFDVNSIRKGFITAIENGSLRDKHIENGLKNVERFSLSNISSQYLKIYEELSSL